MIIFVLSNKIRNNFDSSRENDGALPMFMKAADVRYCRSAFERFDKDNSGTIDTKVRN